MATERMLDLAFQYQNMKLWKRLQESELFAVQLPDGKTGYCNVWGMTGGQNALILYIGDSGFESYRMASAAENSYLMEDVPDWFLIQDCIQCVFESRESLPEEDREEVINYAERRGIFLRGPYAFPCFIRFAPNAYPCRVESETDESRICEALAASAALAEMLRTRRKTELGLTELQEDTESLPMLVREGNHFRLTETPVPQPFPDTETPSVFLDAETASKLEKLPKQYILECEALKLGTPLQNQNGERWFPTLLLCVDPREGAVLPVVNAEPDPDALLTAFTSALLENGFCPKALKVRNQATRALLDDFCIQMGVLLTMDRNLPGLDAVKEHLMQDMRAENNDDEYDDDDDEYDDEEDYDEYYGESGGDGNERDELRETMNIITREMDRLPEYLAMTDQQWRNLPEYKAELLQTMDRLGLLPDELRERLYTFFPD